jgi:hypothetical protein
MWGRPHSNGYWGDTRVHVNRDILALWEKEVAQPGWMRSDLFSRLR